MIKFRLIFLALFTIILFFPISVRSEETVDALNQKIKELNQKITELDKAKDTLTTQINLLNSQVELTLLKITQTEKEIKTLESEIDVLTKKMGELDILLNKTSSVFIDQVVQDYKGNIKHPLITLFFNRFNEYLERQKYKNNIKAKLQDTLTNLETARQQYEQQKIEKKNKQTEREELKKKLADQQASLAKQKTTKVNLLEVTKNNEAKYQQLKKATEDELNSLLKAKFVGKREVKAGEPLGLMGNTGYSFGDHLHFGLYNLSENQVASWIYANDIDPTSFLSANTWPMDDYTITQGRGQTKYSYLYSDHFHHGIDLVSPTKTVKAAKAGVAYFYRNPQSSLGNHIKLFHSDGKMTLYLHLQ